jgi:hypothetical protein
MRTKVARSVLLGLMFVFALTLTSTAGPKEKDQDDTILGRAERVLRECFVGEHHEHNVNTPLKLVGAVYPPGANFGGFDIGWVDQATERYYVAESGPTLSPPVPTPGSGAVDVLDAENDLVVGRITGFYGRFHPGCAGPDGNGPNGVLVTPDNRLVVADVGLGATDGGLVKVFDMNTAIPPFGALTPTATISTEADCRADELAYDPKDRIVLVGNPLPAASPSVTFISLNTNSVLGKVNFPTSTYPLVGGIEEPVWDSQLHGGRFLVNVPGVGIVVFNPTTTAIDTIYPVSSDCSGSGLVLGPFQKLLVLCQPGPARILNALNGHLIANLPEIPTADEGWYDPGDGRFYVPSGGASNATPPGVEGIAVIDAETNTALTPFPPGRTGMRSVSALAENNHVFVVWPPPSGVAPAHSALDPCHTMFNLPANTGCIAVYTHESEAVENK